MKKYYFIGLLVIIILLTLLVTGCFTPKKQVEFVLRQSFLGTAYVPVCPYCKSQVGDKATTCRSCSKDFKWVSKEFPCFKCEGKGSLKCLRCSGSGKCSYCNGTNNCWHCKGTLICDRCDGTGEGFLGSCSDCNGTGKCRKCNNTGKCCPPSTSALVYNCSNGLCSECNGTGGLPCEGCKQTGKIIVGK